ncbi:DUF3500 domain-containing protein, partial [bacterium]
DPNEVTECSSSSGIDKVICVADAFKKQLDATQLATAQREYNLSEAKRWSNFPQQLYREKRVGLNFGSMNSTQISYAKALISAAASNNTANEGWDELQQLINADEYLKSISGKSDYGSENFYIALLGTPAKTGKFEIQFGGHHLAFANTYNDGALVGATPSFRGVEPAGTFTLNNKANQPMNQEKDAFVAMLGSLSATELTSAKLSATFNDIVVGPQKDGTFPTTPSGVKLSSLTAEQKNLVLNAIKTYVGDVAESDKYITKYTNELDETYISYSGNADLNNRNDYVRIDGPSVWIEYNSQGGIETSGIHPHSVWRDKTTDYGGV